MPSTTLLVAYASRHGATAEIAEAIAGRLREQGLQADCRPAADVRSLEGYDAVIIGSAVYMKRWLRDARRVLHRHGDELRERPFWIFSSGPFGAEPDPSWSEPPRVIREAEQLGVRAHVVFGGRLPLEPSNFVEKAMVRDTPAEFADLRDWDAIRAWASAIGETALPERSPVGRT